jgi:methylenetetrahydrofolate reductase (NADPH)
MSTKHAMLDDTTCHIEVLTPKQDSTDLDGDLAKFADKYRTVMGSGHVICITDNPMGMLSFQATEIIPELGLPVLPEQIVVHLNTFHTREHLDEILGKAVELGIRYLLVVSGDGSERLPRLSPESIGMKCNAVTSVELLQHIYREYPGKFELGVAFNPYEPQDHEIAKMRRKVDAGARYIITQPVIGRDDRLDALDKFRLPVVIDAWMSKKLHLLSSCVGYEIPEDTPYDPIANLRALRSAYPNHGLYLALLGFKTQLPLIRDVLRR